jgi:hypothetical protein
MASPLRAPDDLNINNFLHFVNNIVSTINKQLNVQISFVSSVLPCIRTESINFDCSLYVSFITPSDFEPVYILTSTIVNVCE